MDRMRAIATSMALVTVLRGPAWAAAVDVRLPLGNRGSEFPPAASDPVAQRCDLLADLTIDPQRVGPGVAFDSIDVARALPACEQAAAAAPGRARYQFLYGRVLVAAKRHGDALRQFTLASQAGYAPATASLGNLYAEGMGVAKDPERAARYFAEASRSGYAPATLQLAYLYSLGSGVPHDMARATELVRQAADAGLPDAALSLGNLYQQGQTVPYDRREAEKWYRKAGDGGVAEGYTLLADSAFDDLDRFSEAIDWYRRAADAGSGYAAYRLGWLYDFGAGGRHPVDASMAAKFYAAGAAKGVPEAQVGIGRLLREGRGVAKDPAAAYRWFLKAAQQEHGSRYGVDGDINLARWEVGSMLYEGVGVQRDPHAAYRWLISAAKGEPNSAPDPYAAQLLGVMYDAGDGVASNPALAVAWFEKAAGANFPFAMTQLGAHLWQGVGVARDETEAIRWFRKAADRGNVAAESFLGFAYMNATGAGRDYTQAAYWLDRAARQGDAAAQLNLASLYFNGWGVARDEGRAKELWGTAAASPISEYATVAQRNLRVADDAAVRRAQARFAATRGQRSGDDPDAAVKVVGLAIGAALLLSLLSGGSGSSSSGSTTSGSPTDHLQQAQQQQQFNDAIAKLARTGTANCFGKTGCASQ